MLDISRSEKNFILALLLIGLSLTAFSYYKKVTPDPSVETVDINAPCVLININRANEFELERLPGIGPVMAGDIVSHRETIGEFTEIAQLKDIKGIGNKKFENIKELVTIGE
ncbi:MAG: helix-hairpin-helix domain-containing protein [Candidatus Omnitrophica bacterium]|nr:helix-hairpin-helix domain-containing protein [Candidatus Omnitrophota bacterium]